MDLWDGPDGQPIIFHGHTITTKILAEDVLLYGIRPYAFKWSSYPLILSLENHLSVDQQTVFARQLEEAFGDMLYVGDVTCMTELPSPEELKNKVVLKTDVEPELSDTFRSLVNICSSIKFGDLDKSRVMDKYYNVSSLSEVRADLEIKNYGVKAAIEHSERQLIRVYPSGMRVGSSNFDPIPYWNSGFQMAALNFQTADDCMIINAGRFRVNANCGFVLKPRAALHRCCNGENESQLAVTKLKLNIISAQNLPRDRSQRSLAISPYVSAQVRGHHLDNSDVFTTDVVPENGLNPCWSSNNSFQFDIRWPEMSILILKICVKKLFNSSDVIAYYSLPVNSIAKGYRTVPLFTPQGKALGVSSLLVHVDYNSQ